MRSRRRRRVASARSSTGRRPRAQAACGGREVEVSSSASTRRRRPSGRTRWIFASARRPTRRSPTARAARGERPERDDHGLVVREHQRREPVAGSNAIATADASLAFDRDAEILERRDVAPGGPPVDPEPVGDLPAREERLRLEQLEELEEPSGRGEHAGVNHR